MYANCRRIRGASGKRLQAGRGERVERTFAHQFDTGGLDRLCVRGLIDVHKKIRLADPAAGIFVECLEASECDRLQRVKIA